MILWLLKALKGKKYFRLLEEESAPVKVNLNKTLQTLNLIVILIFSEYVKMCIVLSIFPLPSAQINQLKKQAL